MRLRDYRPLLILLLALAQGSCAAAALAGAGAATGIYLTTRGAKGLIEGSVADVDRRTGIVLAERGIAITEREVKDNGNEIEIEGKTRDGKDVSIDIKRRTASTTEVEIEVRENAVVWDQEQARSILERIVAVR